MNGFFQYAVRFVLANEGGFVDDPNDPGGATKFGITQNTLNGWMISRGMVATEVEDLDDQTAQQIYFDLYWRPYSFEMVTRVAPAIAMFDASVLFGPAQAVRRAQAALVACGASTLAVDGKIGRETVAAIEAFYASTFLSSYRDRLLQLIAEIVAARPAAAEFEVGWRNRIDKYLTLS